MSQSPILVVFFDAAGTLFHVKGSVGEVYVRYAEKYGLLPSDEFIAKVNQAFKEAFRHAPPAIFAVDEPEKLKQCERLWWFDIVHGVFYRVGMFEGFDEYFEEVYEAFGTADLWEVYPEVPGVLQELKSQGYELGVISNFDTRFFEIFRGLKLDQFFDSITISSLARAAKPSPKIFQYALDQHAVDPEDAVHIGDSVKEDFEGACQANLRGILVDRDCERPLGEKSVVRSLNEIGAILAEEKP
ncbi:MAG: HAD-IA family hydrolase [Nitrospirae bacterium]|nr:HAD-IA family hydrolase [Nitrospirota bacterium]MDA1303596.1 HAD-IA family hydrolase [Nitrospirota bacterium]